jgi:hypothetical protein
MFGEFLVTLSREAEAVAHLHHTRSIDLPPADRYTLYRTDLCIRGSILSSLKTEELPAGLERLCANSFMILLLVSQYLPLRWPL